MKVTIRHGRAEDLPAYINLIQRTTACAYPNPPRGLTSEHFSPAVYATTDSHEHLSAQLGPAPHQTTWLVEAGGELVACASLKEHPDHSMLSGFYVDPSWQGKGIGTKLWGEITRTANPKLPIRLETFAHNKPAQEIYRRWGFLVDETAGIHTHHWPEWPDGLEAECVFMERPATTPTGLMEEIGKVSQIATKMKQQLADLEAAATGKDPERPGRWRHHPTEWLHNHKPD